MKKNGLVKSGNNSSKEQSSKKKKYSKSQNKFRYSLKVKDKKEIKIIPFINVFNEKEKQIINQFAKYIIQKTIKLAQDFLCKLLYSIKDIIFLLQVII